MRTSELGQTEKDRHRRDTAGQPPTSEMFADMPARPVSATFGHSGGLSWISTEQVRRGERSGSPTGSLSKYAGLVLFGLLDPNLAGFRRPLIRSFNPFQ